MSTPTPSPSRSIWFATGAMLLVQVAVSVSNIAIPVLAPVLNQEFQLGPQLAGMYTAIMYASFAVGLFGAAALIDRFGAARVSQFCALGAALGLVVGSTGTVVSIVLCAIIMGIAAAPETPASTQFLIASVPANQRSFIFSLKQTGKPLGTMAAALIIPLLVPFAGWRWTLIILALAGCGTALMMEPVRRRNPRPRVTRPTNADGHGLLHRLTATARHAIQLPGMARLTIVNLVFTSIQTCVSAFLVIALVDGLDYTLALAGTMLALVQVAGVFGRLAWGFVADRWQSPRRMLTWLSVGIVVTPVLLGLSETSWPPALVAALSIALGLTTNSWNGVIIADIARLSPPDQAGATLSGAMMYGVIGAITMPLLFGWAAATLGIGTAFMGIGAIGLIAFWALVRP